MHHQLIFFCALMLITLGFYCLITKRNLLKIIIGFNILSSGIMLLLITYGYKAGATMPVIASEPVVAEFYVNPLPQAMVLTSIVIGAGITALGLSLIIKLHKTYHTLNVSDIARRASE